MIDIFVVANDIALVVAAFGEPIARVFKRRYNRLAVSIEKHLMNAHLMNLVTVVKPCVI